jgi:hypothetical protein
MSNLLANYKLLKRICNDNEAAAANQEAIVNTVNLKGELLIGNGSGAGQLDPSTGNNNDLLSLNSGATLGVQWDQYPDLLPVVQGGYYLADDADGNILPEWSNYYVEITATSTSRTLFLPPPAGLPNGFSVWIFANTTTPGGIYVNGNPTGIESGGVLAYSVSYSSQELDKYVYDSIQNMWHRQSVTD